MRQAKTYEEIKHLIELCRAGRLFEVQNWISEDKPTDPPEPESGRARKRSPLELGFHSLVQVLLEGGAAMESPTYSALRHALWKRRLDMVELLVNSGADIHQVSMEEVFETWKNEIVEYFIHKGADLDDGQPLAYALCSRIRPALGIFKKYENQVPGLKEQVNIELRYHCREGNLKWVSLMLWAGGDPYARGPCYPTSEPEDNSSALELAALHGHFDVFKLKSIRLDPLHEISHEVLRNACYNEKSDLLVLLLEKGFSPRELVDKGTSLIQSLLSRMSWDLDLFTFTRRSRGIDTGSSRERMKMIHMLVRSGARWEPRDRNEVGWARRSFLRMSPDYVLEFLWIMAGYGACSMVSVEELMRTPSMRMLISGSENRYRDLREAFCHSPGYVTKE